MVQHPESNQDAWNSIVILWLKRVIEKTLFTHLHHRTPLRPRHHCPHPLLPLLHVSACWLV